jgi:undecaprenyl-diphosphatase
VTDHLPRRRRADAIAVAVGAAIFLPCALVARSGTVSGTEAAVFRAINGLPDSLAPAAQTVQFLGVLGVGPLIVVAALLWRRWRLAIAAALVTGLKLLAERGVWAMVTRGRPGLVTPGAIVRKGAPVSVHGFVSGHVILATGLSWVLTPYLPGRWKVVPWVVVVTVAWARVYLGAHNPLDVLGGFGVGLAVGGAANLVVGVTAPEPTEGP